MKILSSLEIKAVVEELQQLLGAKVDQVYQPDNTEVVLSLHRTDIGKKLLRIIPGTALYFTTKRRASPKEALNFCRFLRKRLGPTKLKEIIQKDMERIIEFHFEGKDTKFILITEFFSKGNLIVCDKDYMILSALQVQLWKDRKIKAKVKYEYPPKRKIFFEDFKEFSEFLDASTKENVVKTLALGLNLGGVYAEELCHRAQIDKNATKLKVAEQQRVYEELKKLVEEELHPNMVNGNPVPITMHSLGEGESFPSYNDALDAYYSQYVEEAEETQEENKPKKNKYEEMLEDQIKQKQQLEKAAEENQKKAEWIYNNYMDVKEFIELFKAKKREELKKRNVEIEGKNLLLEIE